ncbi:unnamed protein product [Hydatigera taeniaeformis]|uniref:Ovate family protein n=1 Tax=Hydatigena taeniaeformis TaxID=6205 RepID=A0A0R3X171_HYDTA|nr:unnamed protein product [Hydatigera taeniaeformis]
MTGLPYPGPPPPPYEQWDLCACCQKDRGDNMDWVESLLEEHASMHMHRRIFRADDLAQSVSSSHGVSEIAAPRLQSLVFTFLTNPQIGSWEDMKTVFNGL